MKKPFMNRSFLALLLVMTLIFSTFSGILVFAEEGEVTVITIIHTNDIHGRVVEGDFDGMGFGKIATLVDQLKEENPNTLLLDGGDILHGLPFATMMEGESMIKLMDLIGYDVMTPGNHDFNYGKERLLELNEIASFPILAANVFKSDGTYLLEPYMIMEVAGLQVAIFGLATPETLFKSHPKGVEGLTFQDPAEAASKMVKELQGKSDIIIAIGHLGMDEESVDTSIKVAEEVEGIDLWIDGHSHTVLAEGMMVEDTLIVSAGEYGKYLGVVDITLQNGSIIDKKARLISKAEAKDVVEKAEVMTLISEIKGKQDLVLSEVIGKTNIKLEGDRGFVRKSETNLGNLVTDVFLEVTGAEIALTNGGGIRGSIEAGEITRGNIISVFPFGNIIELKRVTGTDLKAMLEHGTDAYPELKGAFPHVAGMTFKIDMNKPVGDRIIDIQINGEPIEMEREYLLATNDFLAAGGDGYTWLANAPSVRGYMAMDEALISYIQAKGVIEPQLEGRITVIEAMEAVETIMEIYIVKPGDWLSKIAIKYGITWEELQEINQLNNPNLIFPGQHILVPIK